MTVDRLRQYGLERMDGDAIDGFLDARSVGVLGLPTDGVPYMVPLSYAYDGGGARDDESGGSAADGEGSGGDSGYGSLYFTYLLGESSRKETLTEASRRGRFLVYDVETQFRWQSVLLSGTLSAVPEAEWPDLAEHPNNSWRPSVLQGASASGEVRVFEFAVDERDGLRQDGLAPDFRENVDP